VKIPRNPGLRCRSWAFAWSRSSK